MNQRLLGGAASPTGWSVQFVESDYEEVLRQVIAWREALGHRLRVKRGLRYPDGLEALEPYEAPWTREVLFPCGSWTAYLNNFIDGGDSTAAAAHLARTLGVRHVMAESTPRYGPGHESTQLWLSGPGGVPPLMSIRTIAAYAEDSRWTWDESGEALEFEELTRYRAKRIRDRLDRQLLVQYLTALGIHVDDDSAYGEGALVQQKVRWKRREVTRAEQLADVAT